MSRIGEPRLPIVKPGEAYTADLNYRLTRVLREIREQVNALSEGQLVAAYAADVIAPTTGTHFQGDVVRNSSPLVLGTGGAQYVITQFICTVSGTPGTWVACRTLTGT